MRSLIVLDEIEYRHYNHLYAVARDGSVIKVKTLKAARVRVRKDGYREVGHSSPRRQGGMGGLVHRMVAFCWLEKPADAKHVHHIDHDKSNNHADNLEWVSPKQHFTEKHECNFGQYVRTEHHRERLRAYRTGLKTSEETKQKQREAAIRLGLKPPPRLAGTKCSEAAKAKMRLNSPNAQQCEVFGVRYQSFNEAGAALGIKPHTLRKRCISASFDDYKLV